MRPYLRLPQFRAVHDRCDVQRFEQGLTRSRHPVALLKEQARVQREGGPDETTRIRYAFHLVTSRSPSRAEAVEIQAWLDKERARFERHPMQARRLADAPDAPDAAGDAAWVMLANTLLNLDEALTKQ